jgi:hypothetical protein
VIFNVWHDSMHISVSVLLIKLWTAKGI